MTKLSSLLFSCLLLLFVNQLNAQTDSTQPPVQVQDTSVHVQPRHDTVRHMTHRDSVRRDSINRARRAIRDSLARLQQAAQADSLAKAAAANQPGTTAAAPPAPTTTPDTASRKPPTAAAATAGDAIREGPPASVFWMKVLASNPYFNFTGTPVIQAFEIHRANSKDSLFYLIIGILFYFALVRVFFEKYFNNLMTLFFRVSLRQQQIREQVLQTPLPSLLLNILFIISAGLYACFLLHYSKIGAGIRFWRLYLYCMLLLSAVYLVKFVVLKFIGWVFSISRATDIYIFVVFLVNKMLGIFLLPFLIIITFSGETVREIFITISLAMVFVLWAYRMLAGYRPVRNEIKLTPFYFFLYLCAFEIAPLLLIYKVLLTYLEKVY
ncbi:MAG: DUF4271 domain-containing protein [Bacteroidetes bacterium]|nr:DUF4271 domain-containing protein [Bacteroidota bacterium]